MSRADELRAELAVVELEERLIAAKEGDTDPAELAQVKDELREARRTFREARSQSTEELAEGDAVARPATVEVEAGVKNLGGGVE